MWQASQSHYSKKKHRPFLAGTGGVCAFSSVACKTLALRSPQTLLTGKRYHVRIANARRQPDSNH